MRTEPVAINAAIMAVLSGVLSLLVAFGFDLTPDQVAAILGVANPLLMLIGAAVTRSIVWSPASVETFLVEDDKPAE